MTANVSKMNEVRLRFDYSFCFSNLRAMIALAPVRIGRETVVGVRNVFGAWQKDSGRNFDWLSPRPNY